MVKGEPWCKRCWAVWSTWFMRAGGKWIDLTTGRQFVGSSTGVYPCDCDACKLQAAIQAHVDELERSYL